MYQYRQGPRGKAAKQQCNWIRTVLKTVQDKKKKQNTRTVNLFSDLSSYVHIQPSAHAVKSCTAVGIRFIRHFIPNGQLSLLT